MPGSRPRTIRNLTIRYRRSIGIAASFFVVLAAATSVQAQQMIVPTGPQYDRVRVSGFLWRSKVSGVLDLEALEGIPGFEDGIGVSSTLGLDEASNGWLFEGNFAAAPRHRFIFAFSRVQHQAEQIITIPIPGPGGDLVIGAQSTLTMREFHGFYNFLVVAKPEVEFGLLGGVDHFDTEASVDSNLGDAAEQISQAFPAFGGNLMVNAQGRVRGYLELTGFPRVKIEDLSGYQFDFTARAEFFIVQSVAAIVGYRRYRLNVDDEASGVGVDVTWNGLTFGGQVRF